MKEKDNIVKITVAPGRNETSFAKREAGKEAEVGRRGGEADGGRIERRERTEASLEGAGVKGWVNGNS